MAHKGVVRFVTDSVELVAEDRGLSVSALLGEGVPQPSGGVGGWEVVPRPLRRPMTVWRGPTDPLRLSLPLLFDGYAEGVGGTSVESQLGVLMRLAGFEKGDPEPPIVTVNGWIPHHGEKWVIEGLEWGDGIRRTNDGVRIRQAVTVTLMRFTEDDRMARIRRPKGRPQYRYIDVHKGDTFAKIAKRELGDARLGIRLARLNDARSPDVDLKRDRVRLPSSDALKDWKRDLKRGS